MSTTLPLPIPWVRPAIDPALLHRLTRPSDLLGWLQAGGYLLTAVATGAATLAAAASGAWGWTALSLFVHGTVCSFMINAVHELVHGTVFRSRWTNRLFLEGFSIIGWISHRVFWASHARHHQSTLHPPHDREVVLPIRLSFRDFLREAVFSPWHMWWTIRGTIRLAAGRPGGRWEEETLTDRSARQAARIAAAATLATHAIIAGIAFGQGWWLLPVVTSLTPLYGRGLHWLLNSTQHVGMQANVPDFRLNTRSIRIDPVCSFLYWRMQHHIEHHLYAGVPCYRLAELHRALGAQLPSPPDLVGAWAEIIATLHRQRSDPSWCVVPTWKDPAPAAEPPPASALVAGSATMTLTAAAAIESAATTTPDLATARLRWRCQVCGFVYDEAAGLPEDGIAPGTAWSAIPDDWLCPECGIDKTRFVMEQIEAETPHSV